MDTSYTKEHKTSGSKEQILVASAEFLVQVQLFPRRDTASGTTSGPKSLRGSARATRSGEFPLALEEPLYSVSQATAAFESSIDSLFCHIQSEENKGAERTTLELLATSAEPNEKHRTGKGDTLEAKTDLGGRRNATPGRSSEAPAPVVAQMESNALAAFCFGRYLVDLVVSLDGENRTRSSRERWAKDAFASLLSLFVPSFGSGLGLKLAVLIESRSLQVSFGAQRFLGQMVCVIHCSAQQCLSDISKESPATASLAQHQWCICDQMRAQKRRMLSDIVFVAFAIMMGSCALGQMLRYRASFQHCSPKVSQGSPLPFSFYDWETSKCRYKRRRKEPTEERARENTVTPSVPDTLPEHARDNACTLITLLLDHHKRCPILSAGAKEAKPATSDADKKEHNNSRADDNRMLTCSTCNRAIKTKEDVRKKKKYKETPEEAATNKSQGKQQQPLSEETGTGLSASVLELLFCPGGTESERRKTADAPLFVAATSKEAARTTTPGTTAFLLKVLYAALKAAHSILFSVSIPSSSSMTRQTEQPAKSVRLVPRVKRHLKHICAVSRKEIRLWIIRFSNTFSPETTDTLDPLSMRTLWKIMVSFLEEDSKGTPAGRVVLSSYTSDAGYSNQEQNIQVVSQMSYCTLPPKHSSGLCMAEKTAFRHIQVLKELATGENFHHNKIGIGGLHEVEESIAKTQEQSEVAAFAVESSLATKYDNLIVLRYVMRYLVQLSAYQLERQFDSLPSTHTMTEREEDTSDKGSNTLDVLLRINQVLNEQWQPATQLQRKRSTVAAIMSPGVRSETRALAAAPLLTLLVELNRGQDDALVLMCRDTLRLYQCFHVRNSGPWRQEEWLQGSRMASEKRKLDSSPLRRQPKGTCSWAALSSWASKGQRIQREPPAKRRDEREKEEQRLAKDIDPNAVFLQLAQMIDFDHLVLLDFLMSNETCFLEYFVEYAKFFLRHIKTGQRPAGYETKESGGANNTEAAGNGSRIEAEKTHSALGALGMMYATEEDEEQGQEQGKQELQEAEDTQKTQESKGETRATIAPLLIRLRMALQRLNRKGLFPYNAGPLVRQLLTIEKEFERT